MGTVIVALGVLLIITLLYSYDVTSKLEKELQETRKISWDRYMALTNVTEEKNQIKRDMLKMQEKLARYSEKLNQNLNKENNNEKEINN